MAGHAVLRAASAALFCCALAAATGCHERRVEYGISARVGYKGKS